MPRVTPEDVKKIIDVDDGLDLEPFINVANIVVNENLLAEKYSLDLLREIEKWLAAHFIALRDKQPVAQNAAGLSVNFGYSLGRGLSATVYGQQVKVLDFSGRLMSLDNEKRFDCVFDVLKNNY